jgi:hypothetical protein
MNSVGFRAQGNVAAAVLLANVEDHLGRAVAKPDQQLCQLIASMLRADPKQRVTAADALRNAYFDPVRDSAAEHALSAVEPLDAGDFIVADCRRPSLELLVGACDASPCAAHGTSLTSAVRRPQMPSWPRPAACLAASVSTTSTLCARRLLRARFQRRRGRRRQWIPSCGSRPCRVGDSTVCLNEWVCVTGLPL